MGIVGCGIGVVSIVRWFEKPGYTGFAVAGLFLGSFAVALGLAYQIKHGMGRLDLLYFSISGVISILVVLVLVIITGVLLWTARRRPLLIWILATYIAIIATMVTVSSALTTADRADEVLTWIETKEAP